jgi:hypothetical protein
MSEPSAAEKIKAAIEREESATRASELAEIKDALQRSTVKIETNSKGMAQVKLTVCAGETEDEMRRIADLTLTLYDEMLNKLGRRASF